VLFGMAASFSSRLLECSKTIALVSGVFTSTVVLFMGLLPLTTEHPLVCAEVSWHGGFGVMIYPIVFVGASGSFYGLAVAGAWLRCKRGPAGWHNLGKLASVYFLTVAVCNLAGLIGLIHMSCHQEHLTGLPFYIGWLVSSFITNLILQKIVVMRASLVDRSRLPSILRWLFCIEVVIALVLFSSSVFLAIAASTRDYDKNARHEEEEDTSTATRNKVVAVAVVLISLLFAFFDMFFSFVSTMAMRSGIIRIKEIMAGGTVTRSISQSSGLLHWANSLDRAVFFARLNLLLVFLSVTTTTLFYVAFISMVFCWVVDTSTSEIEKRYAFLFVAWLLDSVFNDLCVIFVGFGPTSNALATVGQAAKADIIGAATSETSSMSEDSVVVGTVLAAGNASSEPSKSDLTRTPSTKSTDPPSDAQKVTTTKSSVV